MAKNDEFIDIEDIELPETIKTEDDGYLIFVPSSIFKEYSGKELKVNSDCSPPFNKITLSDCIFSALCNTTTSYIRFTASSLLIFIYVPSIKFGLHHYEKAL